MNKLDFSIDTLNMKSKISEFPEHIKQSWEVSKEIDLNPLGRDFEYLQNIIWIGMGGSAIGGYLVKSLIKGEVSLTFDVISDYNIPYYIGPNSLVFLTSYSGNTEEVLFASDSIYERGSKCIIISSGGKLSELKWKNSILVKIPQGYMPREAIGYFVGLSLGLLNRIELIKIEDEEIEYTYEVLKKLTGKCQSEEDNPSIEIAKWLSGFIPCFYGTDSFGFPLALRFKSQWCENAKLMAISGSFPEMNHNEIVPLSEQDNNDFKAVFISDVSDHQRNKKRFKIVNEMLNSVHPDSSRIIEGFGNYKLTRMLYLLHLGDWSSYYSALLNSKDPSIIKSIDLLKEKMSEID